MASNEETMEVEDSNGYSYSNKVKLRIKDPSKKVAQTKELLSKQAVQTKEILSKQAVKIAKQAEEHESFINKVTHLLGVLGFGGFCFILGARPQDVRYLYCLFYVIFVPLRWMYYRYKKWHYYLLDFCYYANTIFLIMLLCYPRNEKLFMVCFSFAEPIMGNYTMISMQLHGNSNYLNSSPYHDIIHASGKTYDDDGFGISSHCSFLKSIRPLAWALIVWRCSLVFNSMDKIVSVFIHLLPGLVFFTIRWWDPVFFEAMHPEGTARRTSWPYVESKSYLWTWLFFVPLGAYLFWQLLYFLIVNVLRRQRLLRDPEVMTSYRELSKKAQKANNIWWRLSGLLGDQNRLFMYILFQAMFTVATTALTVPIFLFYELHVTFQVLKVSATVWNGGNFLLEVMPRQVILKEKKKTEVPPIEAELDQLAGDNSIKSDDFS
ncbi:glycerophosphocholine acyltransferase [Orobanche hederae]